VSRPKRRTSHHRRHDRTLEKTDCPSYNNDGEGCLEEAAKKDLKMVPCVGCRLYPELMSQNNAQELDKKDRNRA